MDAARRSLVLSFAGRYGAMPLRLGAMLALARLLSPGEFGSYAAALAVVQLSAVLTDLGLTQYLVQAAQHTEADRRAALGLGLVLGGAAAVLVATAGLLAPPEWLAPEAGRTMAILAPLLLLHPATAVATARLQRELRFGPIALAGIAGAATFAAGAILLAAAGLGPISLAIAGLAEAGLVLAVLSRWGKLPRPSLSGWRPVLGFGWVWTAIAGFKQAGDSLAQLAVSALLGLPALGLLSRAQAMVQLFDKALLDAVSPVVLPAVAAAQRSGRPLAPVYLRQVACLAAVAWPFFGALALLADPVVALLLGRQWLDAVPLVRLLALAGLFLPLSGLMLPYLIAIGRIRSWLPAQGWLQGGRVLAVALAATQSLELACLALATESAAKAAVGQRLLGRHLGCGGRETLAVLARSALPSLACLGMVVLVAMSPRMQDAPPWLLLPVAALAGLPAWLLVLAALRHPLHEEILRLATTAAARWRGTARVPQLTKGTPP